MGHEEGQVVCRGGRGGVGVRRSMALARLQAFFGASVAVSVTAALRMRPAIVPLPICFTPACRDNKGYL